MQAGDVIIHNDEQYGWSAVKLLVIDTWPDGSETFHCLMYRPMRERPTPDAVAGLDILGYHAPIDGAGFRREWQVLCSPGVAQADLVGFVEYLKLTDFPRYLEFTGQDVEDIAQRAIEHYQAACALGDQERRHEAIDEYTVAIDLMPSFFEAIDNRAFTLMELGRLEEALADFEQSLRVNPDGNAAFFSRGECLLKLGRHHEAEQVFLEGTCRFPDHRAQYQRFLELAQSSGKRRPDASGEPASAFPAPADAPGPAPPEQENAGRPGGTSRWWRFWR